MKEEIEIEKICFYCEHSVQVNNSDSCVCNKKGIVKADGKCLAFKADILKYNPKGNWSKN